jgi:hypothetical protein
MRTARRRLGLVAALLAGGVLLLAGCGTLSAVIDTEQALRDAGYQSVSVGLTSGGDTVTATVSVSAPPTNADLTNVAEIVWHHVHLRFSDVRVTVHGSGQTLRQQYTFDELQAMFGARNPSWNKTTVRQSAEYLGLAVIGGVVVVGAVVVGVVIVVARRRRRRAPPRWGGGPGGWAGPGGPGAPGAPLWPPPPGPPWAPWTPGAAPPAGGPPAPAGDPRGQHWTPPAGGGAPPAGGQPGEPPGGPGGPGG